jgi:pimeloyl-ACP methyl ester carboxylesterase
MHRRQLLELMAGTLVVGAVDGPAVRATARLDALARTDGVRGPTLDLRAWREARRFAHTKFGRIAYVERGRGAGALFLHGFPLSGFQWRGALERLSAERRCIAPDFLALGDTEVASGQSVGPDAQVAMLVALLDALAVGPVDVVANDSGGAVAQLLMTRHPERVRTLLLTNCDVEGDSPPPALTPVIALAREGRFVAEWLAPWVADPVLARSPKGLGGLTYTYAVNPSDDAIAAYLAPLVGSPARQALANAYAVALAPDPLAGIEPALRRSTVPTRIVWGTGDTTFSARSPDYLDRTLGASRGVRRVEGANLFFPEEFPDLIAEEAQRLWTAAS